MAGGLKKKKNYPRERKAGWAIVPLQGLCRAPRRAPPSWTYVHVPQVPYVPYVPHVPHIWNLRSLVPLQRAPVRPVFLDVLAERRGEPLVQRRVERRQTSPVMLQEVLSQQQNGGAGGGILKNKDLLLCTIPIPPAAELQV